MFSSVALPLRLMGVVLSGKLQTKKKIWKQAIKEAHTNICMTAFLDFSLSLTGIVSNISQE